VAQLTVRNLGEELVQALRERAARHGRSAEEEHRQILKEVLRPDRPRVSLKDLISQMPEVGEEDFTRIDDLGRVAVSSR
jgi:plasmid stability protein